MKLQDLEKLHIKSPCIDLCKRDDENQRCLGCFRTYTHLKRWNVKGCSNIEKLLYWKQILESGFDGCSGSQKKYIWDLIEEFEIQIKELETQIKKNESKQIK
jgi:predicted Fe-S protein YdhL (DUF1289 family)